jgi:hypothetical protein
MTVFNRLVVIIGLIALIVTGLIIALVPEQLLASLQGWTAGAVVTSADRIASAVLGIALVALAAIVLFLELRLSPRKTVIVSNMTDGKAALELSSIAQRVRQQVEALDGVRRVTPHVVSRGRTVDVRLVVAAAPEVDVPSKANEIAAVIRDTVGKMGVTLGKQRIDFRQDSGTRTPQKT